jgi:hypothetical protein
MTFTIEQPQRWTHAGGGNDGLAAPRPWLSASDLCDLGFGGGGGTMVLIDPAPTAAEVDALLSRMHALSLDMAQMAHRLEEGLSEGCASPAMVLDAIAHGEASAKLARALALALGGATHRPNTDDSLELSAAL